MYIHGLVPFRQMDKMTRATKSLALALRGLSWEGGLLVVLCASAFAQLAAHSSACCCF